MSEQVKIAPVIDPALTTQEQPKSIFDRISGVVGNVINHVADALPFDGLPVPSRRMTLGVAAGAALIGGGEAAFDVTAAQALGNNRIVFGSGMDGIRLGTSAKTVIDKFGKPTSKNPFNLIYFDNGKMFSKYGVTFDLHDGTVTGEFTSSHESRGPDGIRPGMTVDQLENADRSVSCVESGPVTICSEPMKVEDGKQVQDRFYTGQHSNVIDSIGIFYALPS